MRLSSSFRSLALVAALALSLQYGGFALADVTSSPTLSVDSSPTSETANAEPEISQDVQQLVSEVQRRVALLRGLPSKAPVDYRPLTPEQLEELVRDSIDEQYSPGDRKSLELIMRRMRLFRPEESFDEIFIALLSEQVAGLYDDDTGRLYVLTTYDLKTPLAEIILAHEICHALQDQYYDLKSSPIRDRENDDKALAGMAVLEGDASILMSEYGAVYVEPFRMLSQLPQMLGSLSGSQSSLQNTPYIIQQQMMFPYVQGAAFMHEAIARGARDKVFEKFPRSTEQILHPEKYFSKTPDEPVPVDLDDVEEALPEGWAWRYSNVIGQIGVQLFFEANFNPFARVAAEGWGGDRFALAGPADQSPLTEEDFAVVWKTVWDTERDAEEFFRAMDKTCADRLYGEPGEARADGWRVYRSDGFFADLRLSGDGVVYVDSSDEDLTVALADRATPVAEVDSVEEASPAPELAPALETAPVLETVATP